MSTVSGKVLHQETGRGLPDLLVEIFDATAATGTGIAPPPVASALTRLGTGITNGDGSFRIEYADFPDGRRPRLLLIVKGPESMDEQPDARMLHLSPDLRPGAAPVEAYLIRIPSAKLAAAGVPAPTTLPLAADAPADVARSVGLVVARQVETQRELQQLAAEQVNAERSRTAEISRTVHARLQEAFAGVAPGQPVPPGYVPPDADAAVVRKKTLEAVERTVKAREDRPERGQLVVTQAELERLRNADGTVLAERVERVLYRRRDGSRPSSFLTREEPLQAVARSAPPDLLARIEGATVAAAGGGASAPGTPAGGSGAAPGAGDDGRSSSAGSAETSPSSGAVSAVSDGSGGANGGNPGGATPDGGTPDGALRAHVARLLASLTAPEDTRSLQFGSRANSTEVEARVGTFRLHSGPADVPAYYDFHSLQIAFDYLWQRAIDEGVLEGTEALSRQLVELGGDPLAALNSGGDPIRALRREVQTVTAALSRSPLGTMARVIGEGPPSWVRPLHPDLQVSSDFLPPFPPGGGGGGGTPPVNPGLGGAGGPLRDPVVGPVDDPNSSAGNPGEPLNPHDLLNQIEGLLHERYAFECFAPGSVNFGLLVSYRQKWTPVTYQVGNLVKTLTLTPKETRKVSSKRVIKKDRSVREMEQSLRVRKEESSDTGRDEREIVAKAEAKTNFSLNARGSYNVGIAKGNSTTDLDRDAASSSSDVKKAFREAVLKAAQEYREERKLEVEAKDSYEEEVSETWEISNPNDELPVTFLFYELQRRYRVSEHIHRLTPVVLVAMDVPNPSRRSIDALLFTHGWIINRVLLDDQFRPALEYLRHRIVGDASALRTLATNVELLTSVVTELKRSYSGVRSAVNTAADALHAMIQRRAGRVSNEGSEGWWEKAKEAVVGDGGELDLQAARIMEDAAREAYERAVNQEKELRSRLDSETAALTAASEAYARAQAEHLNHLMNVSCLRLHVKENILYYMQAIWSHTFQDQTFLALHQKRVPRLSPLKRTYRLSDPRPAAQPGHVVVDVEALALLPAGASLADAANAEEDWATLAEVADLDNLLGFKGNYLIFPLKQGNALTDFMMTPYVDAELGLRDPDPTGNWTPEEFIQYARTLYAEAQARAAAGEAGVDPEAVLQHLSEEYAQLLSAPRRAEDEIVVPSGSLYVEALPGAHPILEEFKMLHRAVDVKKVLAEVRRGELESLRYAARVLAGERGDPDVERQVLIDDPGGRAVVPGDGG